jgi:hypothetical protein
MEPATETRYNFRFSAQKAFTEKLTRLAEVLGIENPHNHLEDIFGEALEIALEKKDPQRRLARRRKREDRRASACRPSKDKGAPRGPVSGPAASLSRRETKGCGIDDLASPTVPLARPKGEIDDTPADTEGPRPGERSTRPSRSSAVTRYIRPEVQERVMARADYQCEYRGPDGRRCRCRTGLQIEHTRPFAVYQTHDERYLRAYCSSHNLFAAREYYGAAFIQEKIEAARRERDERAGARGVP